MRPPTSFTYSVSSGSSRKLGSRKRISRIACSPILRSRYGDSSAPDVSPSSGRVCARACGTNNARPRQTAGILMDNMIPLSGFGSRTRRITICVCRSEAGGMNRSRKLSHFDGSGQAHMVNVGDKPETHRVARASGTIRMAPSTLKLVLAGRAEKGDVLGVARVAAIQAAKRTGELIPLCHSLGLTRVAAGFTTEKRGPGLRLMVTVEPIGRPGQDVGRAA